MKSLLEKFNCDKLSNNAQKQVRGGEPSNKKRDDCKTKTPPNDTMIQDLRDYLVRITSPVSRGTGDCE